MSEIIAIIIGALLGSALGYALTRIRTCRPDACNVKANLWFSILAGAIFGAGVARFFWDRFTN